MANEPQRGKDPVKRRVHASVRTERKEEEDREDEQPHSLEPAPACDEPQQGDRIGNLPEIEKRF